MANNSNHHESNNHSSLETLLGTYYVDKLETKTWVILDVIQHTSVKRGTSISSYVLSPSDDSSWYMELSERDFKASFKRVQAPHLSSEVAKLEHIFRLDVNDNT